MKRIDFLAFSGISIAGLLFGFKFDDMSQKKPEVFYFEDDGSIPNSKYPLLVYRNVFTEIGDAGAEWLEKRFAANKWTNSWRNGIYSFHHYHSNTHEVLGIYNGFADVQMGGEKGKKLRVNAGDVIIIPAGVGHKKLEAEGLAVVGAYPNGLSPDLMKGSDKERVQSLKNIANVVLPDADPLWGEKSGLINYWK